MKTQPHFTAVVAGTTSMISLLLFGVVNPVPTNAQNSADIRLERKDFLVSQATGSRIRFVPPVKKNPRQSQGAGSRGCNNKPLGQNLVTLLIPSNDYVGQTISGHPTFSWYLSEPVAVPMQFALVEDKQGGKTVWQKQIDSSQPGFIQVEIPKDQPELLPGKTYRWTVSLVCNSMQPSANRNFISFIERVPITPALEQQLSATNLNRNAPPKSLPSGNAWGDRYRASIYAESGLWYDAIAVLSTALKPHPQDSLVQGDLLSLLDQVGLSEVANQERQRFAQK